MPIAALLPPEPGVVARADTPAMLDIRILELAGRQGRVDAPAARLTHPRREALDWLAPCRAARVEADRSRPWIVLDRDP